MCWMLLTLKNPVWGKNKGALRKALRKALRLPIPDGFPQLRCITPYKRIQHMYSLHVSGEGRAKAPKGCSSASPHAPPLGFLESDGFQKPLVHGRPYTRCVGAPEYSGHGRVILE